MPKLIIFSSFMLFWVFFEVSGGTDFAPRERVVMSQAPFTQNTRSKSETVRMQDTPVVISAKYEPVVTQPLATTEPALPAPAVIIDLRFVDANRVNLREGPSITDPVIDTITRGIAAEVIIMNDDGWAQIRLTESGQMGWMATRLLSEG